MRVAKLYRRVLSSLHREESGMVEGPESLVKVTYDFKRPVELGSFTASLEALADLHKLQLARSEHLSRELRLYIRDIREGSIEVDLVEMLRSAGGTLAPVLTHATAALDMIKRTKEIFQWLKEGDVKPENVERREIEHISRFLTPVAENRGSNVLININGSPNAVVVLSSLDADAIQNSGARALQELKKPVNQTFTEVPMVWYQTDREGSSKGKTRLKAIIDTISEHPMPVYFVDAERNALKKAMIDDVEYLYNRTFIVDVETIVVTGDLKGYRIIKLHDVLY